MLRKNISQNPLMLHGASAEAVAQLFETGALPPGKYGDRLQLGFAPVKSQFAGTEIYSKISDTCTVQEALQMGRFYAKCNAIKGYLISNGLAQPELGERADWLSYLEKCNSFKDMSLVLDQSQMRDILRDFHLNNYDARISRKMLNECLKRKGVIIEVGRKILELESMAKGRSDEVILECPQGLPMEYVAAVSPCSSVDDALLKRHISGLLKQKAV